MELKQLYREIVNEHNLHPVHKKAIENPDLVMRGVNPSCGDDITLSLKIENGVITDAGYEGSGCAISQASVDMMADQVIGKSKDEAIKLAGTFMGMIKGEITDEESIEALDEAAALQDVAHMPARVKCAVLGWHTMQEMLENPEKAQG
ncbi:MAG: SUF system NifU family Fe-S cluster assembly protein [Butyrivibrio sp.]|uniref:Fe-S cluster assembly sulfur transfer protein SufU n=1 Tax=Butyrivibrio sp. FCS014 TaxID=1408304 RepID=UPI0004653899|nr:SUF system NifU family Fe-S cluster assembly protein [Butyrivibrio sp. FCS014]MBE5825317.1 SUF system NifU family Fe-S cluster assembly protein [Butyrivibrio sp.]MCR5156044.1 SUF system NifU family Fe-S cluster assembly protein [Butyrivibrio sp.]